MKILVTGAAGYIGGSVAKKLADEGHEVWGLVRNPQQITALSKLAINPVLGTLDDQTLLSQYASSVDAVINAADSDHRDAAQTIIAALRGSGKIFIHTSGSSVVGDDAKGEYASEKIYSDDSPFIPVPLRKERADLNNDIRIAGIKDGIKTMVITPSMIYGNALGLPRQTDQIPKLIQKSQEQKAGVYIGKGLNRWSNVHIKDLVDLYSLALAKGPSGAMFFAENGEASLLTIAEAISQAIGHPGKTHSWNFDDAVAEYGNWARFAIASNSRIKADNARNLLGWNPKEESIEAWIKKLSISKSA